ncbi:ABC transporter permease [Paenibacillus sp. Marseille-Q4541]|uniref:ABC transporter permease n=1 Tax=Paenibacillus sp. Marseille-Q4541 TaxID=2831522 RepID=UPI001BAAE9DF|nr:ABC transporter permease [Paenibacillus sp. Marseille-Q4541]
MLQKAPRIIFWRRFRTYIEQQRKALATVVDWIVMLYILIPGLLIGGGIYIDFWTDPLPDWSAWIPLPVFAVVIWILFSGKLLLFLEDADVLFLRQQKTWMKQIMLRGVLVSFLTNMGKGCLLSMIVLPFMVRNFEFDFTFWVTFFIFIAVLSCVSGLAERMIGVNYSGWKGKLLSLLPTVLAIVLIMITIRNRAFLLSVVGIPLTLLLMIFLLWLIGKRIRMTGTFMRDVHEDNKTKMVLTEKLLSQATEKPTKSTSKTWLFTKSQRLYKGKPEKRLANAGIKAFLRKKETLLMYTQISFIGIPAIWLPPIYIKSIMFVLILFMIAYWLFTRWNIFSNSDYLKVLPYTEVQHQSAAILAVRTLYSLPAFLLSSAFGLSVQTGLYGVLLAIVTTAVSIWIVPGIALLATYRQKSKE